MAKNRFGTVAEIALVVMMAAVLGIAWNGALLADAWRGRPTQQQAEPAARGEVLPMPIGLMQVKEMLDAGQAVLVDARSSDSFAKEHIAGALPLPLEEARRRSGSPLLDRVPADAVIIAYCNGFSCQDSMDLGKLLIKGGYGSVYVFEGGLPEWPDAGYPVAGGEK